MSAGERLLEAHMEVAGEWLSVQARKEAGKQAKEVAEVLGLKGSTVSCFEHGRSHLKDDQITVLCKLYGCSSDYLLALVDEREEKAKRLFLRFAGRLNPRGMLRLAEYSGELAGNPKFRREAEGGVDEEPEADLPCTGH